MESTTPILEFKNVSFVYDSERDQRTFLLDNVSFKIPEGSYTTIIGHNGCGKSTLLKLISYLLLPTKGEVFFSGEKISEETVQKLRLNLSVVFQNPENQFVGTSVRDDVAFALENNCVPHTEMIKLVNKYTKLVGIDNLLDREPHRLSGGQKQKVALAGALASGSKLILLDEVTSMLDPASKNDIKDLIIKTNKELKKTIISITHDMEELNHSDFTLLMNKGKIVDFGKTNDIIEKYNFTEFGVDYPFAHHLSRFLNKYNKKIKITLSIKNLAKQICKYHLKT